MKTHRLFFALWPDDSVRQSIVDVFSRHSAKGTNGRVIASQNLHITLHFIGNVSTDEKNAMHTAVSAIRCSRFELQLDSFGCFSRAKILWMGLKNTPAALTSLHKEIGMALTPCGFSGEQRPYTPHLSLIRKYHGKSVEQLEFSILWSVDKFALVESISVPGGVNYRVIEQYKLS